MGIPNHESWLRREYYPTGTARGWRRTGCLVMLIGGLVLVVVALLVALVVAVA